MIQSPFTRQTAGPSGGEGYFHAFRSGQRHATAITTRLRKAGHCDARIAQLVEQRIENPRVGGSNPSPGTILSVYNQPHDQSAPARFIGTIAFADILARPRHPLRIRHRIEWDPAQRRTLSRKRHGGRAGRPACHSAPQPAPTRRMMASQLGQMPRFSRVSRKGSATVPHGF